MLHFSDTLLSRTETFVQARLLDDAFQSVAVTWHHVPDGLAIPCPFVVIDRHVARGPNRGPSRLLRGAVRMTARQAAILRVLIGARPDIVHAHFATVGSGVSPFCHALAIPLVVSFYGFDLAVGPDDRKLLAAYARMFRQAAAFTAEGPVLARRLVTLGAPAERVRLLPLSLPDWALTAPPSRPSRPARTLRLLQVARFVEKKGVDLSLRAVAAARARGVDAQLVIAGGGPLDPELRRLAGELCLGDAARFIGYVQHDSLVEHMSRADAIIQPSRTAAGGDTEGGHPTILIEALAQGVPIIATRHADIPFVVHDEENGLLADEGDVMALAANIERLASDSGLLDRLSASARVSVIRRHGPSVLRKLKERIYREAIRRSPRSMIRAAWRTLPVTDPFQGANGSSPS